MSTPASSNGDSGGGNKDKTEKITHSSDTNGSSTNTCASHTGNSSRMKVQEFMSYLAKEANITNMTVETNDGRRISATFKDGLPISASTPGNGNGSATSDSDPSTVIKNETEASSENSKTAMMSPTRDTAKAMAMIGSEKNPSTPSTQVTPGFGTCTSPEWAVNYQSKHVSVKYSTVETGQTPVLMNGNLQITKESSVCAAGTITSLPPKKRSKVEEGSSEGTWNAMSALVDAATVAQREHEKVVPGFSGASAAAKVVGLGANIAASLKKKPTKRKPRKIIPEIKEYVEFTQKDVLFGRGGRSNHHPGNKIYREIVTDQQNHYRGCDKNEKTRVAQGIVDRIHNEVGGRFLELDRDVKRWFLVPNVVARRKVGQALRENNTEVARAAKRAKYQGRLNSKKKTLGTSEIENGIVPMASANNSSGAEPTAVVNGTNSNIRIQVGANGAGTANPFPIDDVESSKRVEV